MNKLNLKYSGLTVEVPLELIQDRSLGIEVRFVLIVILSLVEVKDPRFSDTEAQLLSGLQPDQFQWVMEDLYRRGFVKTVQEGE